MEFLSKEQQIQPFESWKEKRSIHASNVHIVLISAKPVRSRGKKMIVNRK
jgi:hypothetical protein